MTLTITRLSPALGAEVRGVNLADGVDDDTESSTRIQLALLAP